MDLEQALAAAEEIAGHAGGGNIRELPEHQEHILTLGLEVKRLRDWLRHLQGKQRLDLADHEPKLLDPLLTGDQRSKVHLGGRLAFEEVAFHCRDALGGAPAPDWTAGG